MAVNSPETRGQGLFTAILFEATCNNYYITTKIDINCLFKWSKSYCRTFYFSVAKENKQP